ncbi:hypothetical protein U9M48_028619 [Paspalum notatum var. saurae]|uniref:Uncharacterized protein n=1 Tax=Paspalum notatum var. saurae TaxID=547442 RepID=A0AAQ3TWU6_PASNO
MSPSDSSSTTGTTPSSFVEAWGDPNRQLATPDPLSALALLENEQKFKLGGVDGRNLTISTVNYQPNGAMQVPKYT